MRMFVFSVFLLVLGCAHSSNTASDSQSGQLAMTEDTSPVVTPDQIPWKDMTSEQRGRYMAKVVMPKMRDVFQGYDAQHFAKVTCATCHGKSARDRKFKMPSPDLPALPASPKVFMETVMKEKPDMVKFMGEKVTPTMAMLLGRPAFDHAKPDPTAFSCQGCHTLKGAPEPGQH